MSKDRVGHILHEILVMRTLSDNKRNRETTSEQYQNDEGVRIADKAGWVSTRKSQTNGRGRKNQDSG